MNSLFHKWATADNALLSKPKSSIVIQSTTTPNNKIHIPERYKKLLFDRPLTVICSPRSLIIIWSV